MSDQARSQLELALKEIGKIEPWRDDDVQAFVFEHPAYPVRYAGDTEQEVIESFPLYLLEFIEERLKDNIAPFVEEMTRGHGGRREGAGRPKGTTKEPTKMVRLPEEIAIWLKSDPRHLDDVRNLMAN